MADKKHSIGGTKNVFIKKCLLEKLHYQGLNILNLIIRQGYMVCFCDKYEGPRLLGEKCLCPMCRIPRGFSDFEEYCDRYQFNECKCYTIRLFDFLNECFIVNKESLQITNNDSNFSYRNSYTGQKTYTSLKDHIK